MRARRLQMECNINDQNVEAWQVRKFGRHKKHKFVGAGKSDNKHGVGIMLNKKWRQKVIDTEYMIERATTATIVVNLPTHQTDECLLHPLVICGPPR